FDALNTERIAHPTPECAYDRARFGSPHDGERVVTEPPKCDPAELPISEMTADEDDAAPARKHVVQCGAIDAPHRVREFAGGHPQATDEIDRVSRIAAVGEQRQPAQFAVRRVWADDAEIVDERARSI